MRLLLVCLLLSCGGQDKDACEALKQCRLDAIVQCTASHTDSSACLEIRLVACEEYRQDCEDASLRSARLNKKGRVYRHD